MITAAFDRRVLAALFATAAVATPAQAEVVVDNLGEPVRFPAPLHETFWYAQSFLTDDAASPGWLDEVTLRLGVRVGDPTVVAQLLADAGDSPGAALTSFIVPTITTGTATNTVLTPVDLVQLQPGTQYWVLMGVTGAGGYDWDYAEGNGQFGSGSFWTYAYSEDMTATWTGFGNENPLMMRVDVTPVPEPTPALLLAAGLAALSLRRRRG
jgi:hypothetical protein